METIGVTHTGSTHAAATRRKAPALELVRLSGRLGRSAATGCAAVTQTALIRRSAGSLEPAKTSIRGSAAQAVGAIPLVLREEKKPVKGDPSRQKEQQMTRRSRLSELCVQAMRRKPLLAVLAAGAFALPALAATAMADDKPLSIYFVGCAAPTGFHGYLARGADEAGKNLGVNVTYIYPDQLTIPNQVQKIEEAIAAQANGIAALRVHQGRRPMSTSRRRRRRPASPSAAPPRRLPARRFATPTTSSSSAPARTSARPAR